MPTAASHPPRITPAPAAQVDPAVILDARVSHGARFTYVVLTVLEQEDHGDASRERLAAVVGVHRHTLARYLDELTAAGLLKVEAGVRGRAPRYTLLPHPAA